MHVWFHFCFDGHREYFVGTSKQQLMNFNILIEKFEVSSNMHLFDTFSLAGGKNKCN